MSELFLALGVFLISHLIPSLPGVRAGIIARIGRRTYGIVYGLISLVLFAWVIVAALRTPTVMLWHPAGWQAWSTVVLSPIALFLIAAGLLSPNPMSLSARRARDHRQNGAIVSITRHPVFWGFALWSASHIPPNGDTRSVLLFGTMTILAVSGFWLSDKRARRKLGEDDWNALTRETSTVPFVAIAQGRTGFRFDRTMLIALVIALIASAWLLHGGHAMLFNVDPMSATRF